MAQVARKSISSEMQTGVLVQSRRRCALCFHLTGDLAEKEGQIAHLDQNPANRDEDNLAFLCLKHHSLFDSKTSQHKNYTITEVKAARDTLYQAIVARRHHAANDPVPRAGRETDRATLAKVEQMATSSMSFLRGGGYAELLAHSPQLDGIEDYFHSSRGVESEFIDQDLEVLRRKFISGYQVFRVASLRDNAMNFRIARSHPIHGETPSLAELSATRNQLGDAAKQVCADYDDLIRTARRRLAP